MVATAVAVGIMEPVNVRNLEQIQEQEAHGASRLGALILGSLATAAIVTAFVVVTRKGGPAAVSSADPLAALVASAQSEPPAERLEGKDVRFPGVLSDSERPTTAFAAVKDERGRLVVQTPSAGAGAGAPPPATDRLPVVPLPVGTLLGATPVTTAPKDPLTAMAADASKVPDDAELAPAGSDGGFQLQVASFKDQNEADKLVDDLRRRGHRAFRQAAYVPARGLWHRVRIGPFKNRFEGNRYKGEFERNERMMPFLVDPEKVKQAEETRAIRAAAEEKKYKKKTGGASIEPAE